MIDIHSHILPRVDDGSEDMEMSLDMARMYIESGISKVIATPHYIEGSTFTSLEENNLTLKELQEELIKEDLDLEVFLGNEVYISPNIIEDILEEKAYTLNHTKYVLIELPMYDIPIYTETMIYELLLKGYIPIIAHPERNSKIIDEPNILYEYIEKGALAQLNLPSLEGKYGKEIKIAAEILLKHNMIHFVATDAHTNRGRSPNVIRALDTLKSIVNEEDFKAITWDNGNNLLLNKDIITKPPIKYKKKKGLLGSFLLSKYKHIK